MAKTKDLVGELGIKANVAWLRPVPIRTLYRLASAADVLADQFTIGAWGAIMPIGLMLGKPTLIYLDEDKHRWCFPMMPPILNANSATAIAACLRRAFNSEECARLGREGKEWYQKYHSMDVVGGRLVDALMRCIDQAADVAKRPPGAVTPLSIESAESAAIRELLRRQAKDLAVTQQQVAQLEARLAVVEERHRLLRRLLNPLRPIWLFVCKLAGRSRSSLRD